MADEKLNTGPAENISPEAAEPDVYKRQALYCAAVILRRFLCQGAGSRSD